jgi:Ser/Thr protein kinase RdoA (MazF antagonist)
MLKLKNLIQNDQIAKEFLNSYSLKCPELRFWRSSSNVIYLVQSNGQRYFLRHASEDEKSSDMITAEIEYIQFLRNHGIHANVPIVTKDGNYFVSKNAYHAILFKEVGGILMNQIDLTNEIMENYGAELARIHRASKEYSPQTKRPDYNQIFQRIDSTLIDNHECELINLSHHLLENFNRLSKSEVNYGMCHYDFEFDNVFYVKNSKTFNIIDFDDSMYHFFDVDLAQTIQNIEEECSDNSGLLRNAFMQGYKREFPEYKETCKELAKKFIALQGYASIEHSLNNPPDQPPDWMELLIMKLNAKMEEKKTYLLSRV